MALPTNTTPIYTLTIPSTKKELKFRPFLVKDEKALMVAQQSEDVQIMLDTVKEVIEACAKSAIDTNTLASFDIEYIFLQLRAVSVGEEVDLVFACDEDHGEENEKARSIVKVNLENVNVEFPEGHTKKIPLFDQCGVVMKYPTFDTLKKLESTREQETEVMIDIVTNCIDFIYNGDEVFMAKDQSKQELTEFINNLTAQQFEAVQTFFRTMPQLRAYVKYTCPVCGKEHNKFMEGLASFF